MLTNRGLYSQMRITVVSFRVVGSTRRCQSWMWRFWRPWNFTTNSWMRLRSTRPTPRCSRSMHLPAQLWLCRSDACTKVGLCAFQHLTLSHINITTNSGCASINQSQNVCFFCLQKVQRFLRKCSVGKLSSDMLGQLLKKSLSIFVGALSSSLRPITLAENKTKVIHNLRIDLVRRWLTVWNTERLEIFVLEATFVWLTVC